MMQEKCSHNVKWNDACLLCELITNKQIVNMFKEKVEKAEFRIQEIENELKKREGIV